MKKTKILKEDGRYLIFYDFDVTPKESCKLSKRCLLITEGRREKLESLNPQILESSNPLQPQLECEHTPKSPLKRGLRQFYLTERQMKKKHTSKSPLKRGLRGVSQKSHNLYSSVEIISLKDKELLRLSKERLLSLNLQEMQILQQYFKKLGRNPTDVELETLAQTWSEHCKHKVFNSIIEFEYNEKKETIDNLFLSTIVKATDEIREKKGKKDFCVSVFSDNAGVIVFDEKFNIAFKVETHNHPSALDPYGGANTGIGGVIRDPLGTGLGAKPIFNTDVFCFAPPNFPYNKLPKGVLHPKRIFKGVVAGVRDYGNKMGIPTINGSIHFDDKYLGNPIVYCGTVGLIPSDRCEKKSCAGDLVVVVGGKTGRDGIHGATFSSIELDSDSETTSSGAVQIGNPIVEKKMLDVLIKARDLRLYDNITDCGAGGFSSAVGEMGKETGVNLYLEQAPLKYGGLKPWEILLSEAQERMIVSVPHRKIKEFLELCASENVDATILGEFDSHKKFQVYYAKQVVGSLDMQFLHKGVPKTTRFARYKKRNFREPDTQILRKAQRNLSQALLQVLSTWNVASKEWVIRQYDHEVQGGTILKPLQGIFADAPGDASVVCPYLGSVGSEDSAKSKMQRAKRKTQNAKLKSEIVIPTLMNHPQSVISQSLNLSISQFYKGIAVSNGINVQYGEIDPYAMAASAIDEAIRGIIAVGGEMDSIALLDNFCWGNPDKQDKLGELVLAAKSCYDIAVAYETPFISGKDSFYNEFSVAKKTISIPPTLLISAIGIVEDVRKVVSMDFKESNNLIYIIGNTSDEMGGSQYYKVLGFKGNNPPSLSVSTALKAKQSYKVLSSAIKKSLVRACHDCSEGGLGVALAEMCIGGDVGADIDLKKVPIGTKAQRHRGTEDNAKSSGQWSVVSGQFSRQSSLTTHHSSLSLQPSASSFNNQDFPKIRISDDVLLFSESNCRFIVEVEEKNAKKFEKIMQSGDATFALIGQVKENARTSLHISQSNYTNAVTPRHAGGNEQVAGGRWQSKIENRKSTLRTPKFASPSPYLNIKGLNGQIVISLPVGELRERWQKPLRW